MIWYCTECGHRVHRYDLPASRGARELWCLVCRVLRIFTAKKVKREGDGLP